MAETTEELDAYLSDLRAVEDDLPGARVDAVQELRQRGLDRFQETGFPGPKNELWKYTTVKPLRSKRFQHALRASPATVTLEDLEPFLVEGLDAHEIVFVDGRFDPDLSDLSGLPDGVTVRSLAEVLEDEPDLATDHLGEHAELDVEFQMQTLGLVFSQLNTASFQDGAVVRTARNVVVEDPVHVLHVTTGHEPNLVTHPRNLFVAGESSEVTILETYAGLGGSTYFTNGVTEMVAERNAVLDHYKVQRESEQAFHVAQQRAVQDRDATVRSHSFTFGGALTRNDVFDRLEGPGGHATMNGLFAPRGDQHVDNHTFLDHAATDCTSHELYKGVLDGSSKGVFYGTIFVRKGAQRTDAVQHNPNLLLSRDASVNTTPQLEIFADDVTCTHGSTFGPLEEEQVFYLRSRGMDEVTAQGLLTYSFAAEVLESVRVPALRESLDELLLERLPHADLIREAL